MINPVVQALGVGYFGVNFGWHFAVTVLLAHAAYGFALGSLLGKACSSEQRISGTKMACVRP